jgi:hypothetical protein
VIEPVAWPPAALAYDLVFILLAAERFDLVVSAGQVSSPGLASWSSLPQRTRAGEYSVAAALIWRRVK